MEDKKLQVFLFPKCCLCQERYATKTNSHLITWALIKNAINQPGFTNRDQDVTFSISNTDIPKIYVGRSVLPNYIEEISGNKIGENKFLENENPLSRDFIFCPSCENGIGKFEEEFIQQIYTKLSSLSKEDLSLDSKNNYFITLTEFESKLTYIYAYSIFFRTSIGKLNPFSLNPKIQDTLRKIILSIIDKTKKGVMQNIQNLKMSDFKFPILFTYLDGSDPNLRENLVVQTRCDKPYFIWANDIIFRLYSKTSHIASSIEYFYGLLQMINSKEYFPKPNGQISVSILSNEKRLQIIDNALQHIARVNMDNTLVLFRRTCQQLFQRKSTVNEQKTFAKHYSIYSTDKVFENIKDPFIKAFKETFKISE